jgi:hypothetical protein
VDAAGRPNAYNYTDAVMGNPPVIYYRLRIIEATGYSYSSIVMVKPAQKLGTITVNPNPFTDRLQISITGSTEGELKYELMTLDGKQLRMGNGKITRGSNTFFINDVGNLMRGTYMLRILSRDDLRTFRVVKE